MVPNDRPGLLLVNLGTPQSPGTSDVRRYLREFLSDPRVIDIPSWKRWLVLNLFILPFRPRQSAAAYAKIWTDEGSPLLIHGRSLTAKVQERFGESVVVELAMRYGEPSIRSGLNRLHRAGARRIVVFPLYPQYSSAATGSTLEKIFEEAAAYWDFPYIHIVPPFYDHPLFLDACADVARPRLESTDPEIVFFSFHGLPERQIRKSDPSGTHCLASDDCCARISSANRGCYRAQCYATAASLADRLGIEESRRVVCFQSRLGRDPWIRPYTDELLAEYAKAGHRRATIFSPAFVADCLETVEELGIRGLETWQENGGDTLDVIPAVNSDDAWADAVVTIARENARWLASPTDDPVAHPARGAR